MPPVDTDDRSGVAALEARVRQLEDIRAIENLKFRYTAACDSGFDRDAIADCFTEDGRWGANGFGECHGREEIRDFFRRLARVTPQALHYATSPRIRVAADGTTATGDFYLLCLATVRQRTSDVLAALVILGSYADKFAKVNGEWWIEELRGNIRHISEWTQGWAKQPWRE